MFRKLRGRTLLASTGVLCAVAAGVIALALGCDRDGDAASLPAHGCGSAAAATVSAVQTVVAERIYAEELRGEETKLDAARARSYGPLLTALERGETAAVAAAVHALVYKPHWHIVRLRVLRGNRVLADVGGPHVTAPVTGLLRAHGRTLGRYVISVQDDLGYVKLVTHFIGLPIEIYQRGAPVMGTLRAAPAAPAGAAHVELAGRPYLVSNVPIRAFPAGALQASLFTSAAPSAASCAALRLAAWGSVARHVAARFHPLATHYQDLADVLRTVTGGRVFVRAGSRRLAGRGPALLPSSGTVHYGGRRWPVYSWQPTAGQRVYFLTPPG
jgi:hypothetical protein